MRLHVVPTGSQPAAIAALSVWDRAAGVDEVQERMISAAEALLTGAITYAARPIERPIPLSEGQPFVLLDGAIVAGAETAEAALESLVAKALAGWAAGERDAAELLSVYLGAGIVDASAVTRRLQAQLRESGSDVELEIVIGGQPHYPFVLSLE